MIIKPSSRIDKVETYYFAIKLAEIAKLNKEGKDIINLGIGSPDLQPPAGILEALQAAATEKQANMYQSYKGIPELRSAIAKWYNTFYSVDLNADTEVLPLIGSKEGIMHVSMSFLGEGDEVLIPNPGYPAYRMTTLLAGGTPRYYDLNEARGWLPDLEYLQRTDLSKVKLMWINYPNMPTGAKADTAAFASLVDFARENQILLCHDNPYSFILNDKPLSILSIDGAKDVAIELNSLSKCMNMAGWRVGMMCGAAPYIDAVMKFKSNMDSGMYKPIQRAAIAALQTDKSWFVDLNEKYARRRAVVWEIMDVLQCTYDKDSAGLFVWGRIPQNIGHVRDWVDQFLYDAQVFLTPGFIFGSNGERYIRISLCSEIDMLQTALQRIEKVVNPQNILT